MFQTVAVVFKRENINQGTEKPVAFHIERQKEWDEAKAGSLPDVSTVRRFLALPYEERKRMGEEGRKFVEEHFDRRSVVKAYLREMEEIEKQNS